MTPEEIVTKLAEGYWIVYHDDDYHSCGLCEALLPIGTKGHRKDCLWMQAKKWQDNESAS